MKWHSLSQYFDGIGSTLRFPPEAKGGYESGFWIPGLLSNCYHAMMLWGDWAALFHFRLNLFPSMNISACLGIGKVSAIKREENHNTSDESGEVTLTLWSVLTSIMLICWSGVLIKMSRTIHRVEICRDRHDQRSCKICASCVNFPGKQHNFSHNLRRFTHTKCDFALKL